MTPAPTPRELEARLAKVLCEQDTGEADHPLWPVWLPRARAALAVVREALREPTQRMVCEAQETFGMRPSFSAMKKAIKAAIAASPLGGAK